MDRTNGQKTKVWESNDRESDSDPPSDGDRQLRQAGGINADESIGTRHPDWAGEHLVNECGKRPTGKILGQLRELREAHLAYVKAHEERLEKRLNENRQHQDRIINEMNRLEREIMTLLEQNVDKTE